MFRLRSEDAAIPYQAALLMLAADPDGAAYREVASDVVDRPGRAGHPGRISTGAGRRPGPQRH